MIIGNKTCCDFCARETPSPEAAIRRESVLLCRNCAHSALRSFSYKRPDVDESQGSIEECLASIEERLGRIPCTVCRKLGVEMAFFDKRAIVEKGAHTANFILLCHDCAAKLNLSFDISLPRLPKRPTRDTCFKCGATVGIELRHLRSAYSGEVVCEECLRSLGIEAVHGERPRGRMLMRCHCCLVRDEIYGFWFTKPGVLPGTMLTALCEECFDRLGFVHPAELREHN